MDEFKRYQFASKCVAFYKLQNKNPDKNNKNTFSKMPKCIS